MGCKILGDGHVNVGIVNDIDEVPVVGSDAEHIQPSNGHPKRNQSQDQRPVGAGGISQGLGHSLTRRCYPTTSSRRQRPFHHVIAFPSGPTRRLQPPRFAPYSLLTWARNLVNAPETPDVAEEERHRDNHIVTLKIRISNTSCMSVASVTVKRPA